MAKRAAMTLDALKAKKPVIATTSAPAVEVQRSGDTETVGQTLRLNREAWRQLKRLAVDEDKKAHDLMIEAMNMLFKDRKMPPLA